MQKLPLQTYRDCLRKFAFRSYEEVDHTSTSLDVVLIKQLVDLGFLDAVNCSNLDGPSFKKVRITPTGAAVLVKWDEILQAASVRGRIIQSLDRLAWLVVGVLLGVIPQLILK